MILLGTGHRLRMMGEPGGKDFVTVIKVTTSLTRVPIPSELFGLLI